MAYPRTRLVSTITIAIALLGCQRLDVQSNDEGPQPSGTGDGSSSSAEDSDPSDSDPTDDPDPDTGGPIVMDCDPVAQSGCSGTDKCTVVVQADEVGYVCVNDDGNLDPLDDCQPALGSGIDGCPAGHACLADESGSGLCIPLCLDSGDCTDAVCVPELEHDIPYCAADCSPFEGGCNSPLQCRRLNEQFACTFVRPDDVGGQGEPCTPQQDAGCGEGYVCLPGALVPMCASDNCCTTVCDVNVDTCDSPSTCTNLFDAPAPGSESIGACLVPS